MIEVKNLNKSFGDLHVLNDVSVKFEPGKINLIIGASGSGKSVLSKCIVGLHPIDSGSIAFNGEDFITMNFSQKKEVRREIGMLFQGTALFDSLTVEENINELEKIFQVYKKYKPSIKFIISVSPVPLNKTFNENEHVVAATAFSKAKLRVAAQEFVEKHREDAFYFPSFETVMYGCKTPWEEDKRHVSPEAIKRVMELFQKQFLVDQTPLKFYSHVDPGLSVKTTKLKFVFLKIYHQIKKYIKKYVLRFR